MQFLEEVNLLSRGYWLKTRNANLIRESNAKNKEFTGLNNEVQGCY